MVDFKDKKVMIIGAGMSGVAAASLLSGSGADITLYDDRKDINKEELLEKLPADFDGRIALGDIPEDCRVRLDYLILSPGVPKDLPYVLLMEKKGVKIIGEVELAYYYSKGRVIAVTGTNGKTTTTALIGEIMKTCYENTLVVGNIGIPYTEMVKKSTEDGVTVAEMSSFQLDTIDTFRPDVGIVLNITPDHLDRHHTMKNYINAKLNVTKNQTRGDICVLNFEDSTLREAAKDISTKIVWFSSKRELETGVYLENGNIIYSDKGGKSTVVATKDMLLLGNHNYENTMAAVAAAVFMGIPLEKIREAICSFKPVEHRIEYVAEKNGVRYYNDSKGTNPDASIQAVRAMPVPTILIGGGYDKNSEYDDWILSFDNKIRYLVLMGQTREKIAECARKHGFENIVFVESMDEAVSFAYENARPGEAVLLSPCCASWGMFKNYQERGRIFKDLVMKLE